MNNLISQLKVAVYYLRHLHLQLTNWHRQLRQFKSANLTRGHKKREWEEEEKWQSDRTEKNTPAPCNLNYSRRKMRSEWRAVRQFTVWQQNESKAHSKLSFSFIETFCALKLCLSVIHKNWSKWWWTKVDQFSAKQSLSVLSLLLVPVIRVQHTFHTLSF